MRLKLMSYIGAQPSGLSSALGQWVAWVRVSSLSWTANLDVKNYEQIDARLEIRSQVKGTLCF